MTERKNRNLQFWEVVAAVVLGLMIFEWITENKSFLGNFPWWILIVAYIVIGVAIEQWKERRFWKEHDKKELEFVKSQGFESWAEYMEVHGTGEDVRESYKETAAKERAKRQKRSL